MLGGEDLHCRMPAHLEPMSKRRTNWQRYFPARNYSVVTTQALTAQETEPEREDALP